MLRDVGKRVAGAASTLLHRLLGSRAGARIGILLYHRIAPEVPGLPSPSMNVTPHRFREQLVGLLRQGFRFLTLAEALDLHRAGGPVPPRAVVVTFDDGFAGVHDWAWPVMRELRVPSTVFVATGFLDSAQPFPFDSWARAHQGAAPAESWRPLSTSECREMARDGLVELGSHTHSHQDFRGRPTEFGNDMVRSVEFLRDRFGLREVTFAFPFGRRGAGYCGDGLVEAARRAGVRCALSTEAELVDVVQDPFTWGRFNAYDWDTPATLAAKLEGWYGWAPRLQDWMSSFQRFKRWVALRPGKVTT
jgi:peptidoglycan/xylan/chitin deacetylase (PgdA/CDA1 family)